MNDDVAQIKLALIIIAVAFVLLYILPAIIFCATL